MTKEDTLPYRIAAITQPYYRNLPKDFDAQIAALVESERNAAYEKGFDHYMEYGAKKFEAGARAVAEKVKKGYPLLNPSHVHPEVKGWTVAVSDVDQALAAVLGKDGEDDGLLGLGIRLMEESEEQANPR